jgi:hypothetical protein
MKGVLEAVLLFSYPIGTLFSRLHAQLTDIIHTMHIMQRRDEKGWPDKYVLI